jgi:hypothetical protein
MRTATVMAYARYHRIFHLYMTRRALRDRRLPRFRNRLDRPCYSAHQPRAKGKGTVPRLVILCTLQLAAKTWGR